jgi:hypothetical protein
MFEADHFKSKKIEQVFARSLMIEEMILENTQRFGSIPMLDTNIEVLMARWFCASLKIRFYDLELAMLSKPQ